MGKGCGVPVKTFLTTALVPLTMRLPFSVLRGSTRPLPIAVVFCITRFLVALLDVMLSIKVLRLRLSLTQGGRVALNVMFCKFGGRPSHCVVTKLLLVVTALVDYVPIVANTILFFILSGSPTTVTMLIVLNVIDAVLTIFIRV